MQVRLNAALIFRAVTCQHHRGCGFELPGLTLKIGTGAALGLRRIARQLDAIDRKHLAPDQTLTVADEEHLREDARDVFAQGADETGDGGEVRCTVPGQRNKGHLLPARARDGPAADDAPRVGEQHHLEQHRRRIRRGPRIIVAIACIETGQIEIVIKQPIERMLECPRQQLPG